MSWVFVCLLQKMQKIHIIKFLPYFPPHRWGLESHVQERSQWWIRQWYGEVINVTTPMAQESIMNKHQWPHSMIVYKGKNIGYRIDGYQVIILDAFDLIEGFPFFRFRTPSFWTVFAYLNTQVKMYGSKHVLIHTHTRFFLTSLIGGLFARCTWLTWVHIEHGTNFVKLANRCKTRLAYLYDQIIGRLVFRCADKVIWISAGCQAFAHRFTHKVIPVIYRGMDFLQIQNVSSTTKKTPKNWNIVLWFVGRIVALKWLDLLIKAFSNIQDKYPTVIVQIVGDGDQTYALKSMVTRLWLSKKVSFLWLKDREYIANIFFPNVDIVVNPSYQEWLPTSVLEWLLSQCVIVATRVGGTTEISKHKDLILVKSWDVHDLQKGLEYAIQNYMRLKWLSYNDVKDKFSWKRSIQIYHKIFKEMF